MGKSSRGIKSTFNANNFSTLALMSNNRKTTAVRQVKHENTKKTAIVHQRGKICEFITITIMSLIVVGIAIFVTYQRVFNEPNDLMSWKCNKLVALLIKNDSVGSDVGMKRVLENLDYEIVYDINENWNILWSVSEDPFKHFANHMSKLKPHQIVNHISGLSLTTRAFQLPHMKNELENYLSKNPNKRFIIKDCLVNGEKFDGDKLILNLDANFEAREYIDYENSFLIDNHRFDFGVFFLISSVDPLRIYRYKSEVTSRFVQPASSSSQNYFCAKSALEIPSLSKFIKIGGSVKNAMEGHFTANGINITSVYHEIDKMAVKFLLTKLRMIKKPSNNFIQLMRFDFNFDVKMNIAMKSVDTAVEFEGNEQLFYEVLKILGATNSLEFKKSRSNLECPMLSSLKDILVFNANKCFNFPCNESCTAALECQLCLSCLTTTTQALNHLHRSYREQMRCGSNMERIFPSKKHCYDDDDNDSLVNQLSPTNRLSLKWFEAKCDAEGGVWC